MGTRKGTCLCKGCSVALVGDIEIVFAASDQARRLSGGPGLWLALVAEAGFKAQGAFQSYRTEAPDGSSETTWRCPTCGVLLWLRRPVGLPGKIAVPVPLLQGEHAAPSRVLAEGTMPDWMSGALAKLPGDD